MLKWIFALLVQWVIKITITLVAILTVQHLIHSEGYRVEFTTLALATACVIVVTRMWAVKVNN